MLDIVFGIPVSGPDDSFVRRIEHANEQFSQMKVPGAFLADTFPILQHIPAWCPGGAAQRFASVNRPLMASLHEEPFNVVKQDMVRRLYFHLKIWLEQLVGARRQQASDRPSDV